MKPVFQTYLDNLTDAWDLARPRITEDMTEEQILDVIHAGAEKLSRIHQENDDILRENLFSKTAETLGADEAADLSELADALFNYNRSRDLGIAYKIHQLLGAYAQHTGDVDLIVREAYYQGITLHYMDGFMTSQEDNVFVGQVGAYFHAGAAYLDRYEELSSSQTRSFIIRCLGNLKYGIRSIEEGYDIRGGFEEYMDVFRRTMAVVESPHYRAMNPELPWDNYAYAMHYDRVRFLSLLRRGPDPVVAAAVLESAEYVYRHQEQAARTKEKNVSIRTPYVYTAARFHAGKGTAREAVEAILGICERASMDDFSSDNIWAVLFAPEYVGEYAKYLPEAERQEIVARLQKFVARQKEFLLRLPQSEYINQVSQALQVIVACNAGEDTEFYHHVLDYVLACHPPTFVHSKVVAVLTRHFCAQLAKTNPDLLRGVFGVSDITAHLEELLDRAYAAGIYHDLGKCMIIRYVGIYSRRLLDEEFTFIKLHPKFGCSLLKTLGMEDLADAAHYHHCTYDGSGGYPGHKERCPAAIRPVVDVITVVDALDAGTDNVGRSYAVAKSYAQLVEELRAGKGSRYAPEVVELFDDPEFYRATEQLIRDTRRRVYLEAYRHKE